MKQETPTEAILAGLVLSATIAAIFLLLLLLSV